ncbi:alpha-mannosyltransferase Ecym_3545 [Eremothecium cymbalariae DBVPG|uniref:Alpha-1,2-mannosyltransferase n=1 Tax=Eremothecium cymbalariae (strain CBS 270.75 / DBVPG 7215 / KCTC 17166 / NRRL Y-17582) TaxID=931890 RepID=G8JQN5_ERECY|nr:Hypothetical protein Ecym_3545 [Eremothecium cymbalariae DBVPG\
MSASFRHIAHLWRRKSMKKTFQLVLLSVLLSSFLVFLYGVMVPTFDMHSNNNLLNLRYRTPYVMVHSYPEHYKEFINQVVTAVQESAPVDELKLLQDDNCQHRRVSIDEGKHEVLLQLTEAELSKCLHVSDDIKSKMMASHLQFKEYVQGTLMKSLANLESYPYKGDGVIIMAGGEHTLSAMASIKAIRQNGGIIMRRSVPIQIVIPSKKQDDEVFCTKVLPMLDPTGLSTCLFFEDIFDSDVLNKIESSQYKSLALIVSSFRRVLLLDSDTFVVNSIDGYFHHSQLKENGMILWPDYWRRLHHPDLYKIVGINVHADTRLRFSVDDSSPKVLYESPKGDSPFPFHDSENAIPDGSTASGPLLIDKQIHLDTIIMSLYYSFNGPSLYYPLLGCDQGSECEKDTFALAAHALYPDTPKYYQVKTPSAHEGHWENITTGVRILDEELASTNSDEGKTFRKVAMLLYDYIEDTEFARLAREIIKENADTLLESFKNDGNAHHANRKTFKPRDINDLETNDELRADFWKKHNDVYHIQDFLLFFDFIPMKFIRSLSPSYNPWKLLTTGDMQFDAARALKGHENDPKYKPAHSGHYRMYSSGISTVTNYDLELANWSLFENFVCNSKAFTYRDYGYLKQQIENTKDPALEYKKMCKYIRNRVKYLRNTTWKDSTS